MDVKKIFHTFEEHWFTEIMIISTMILHKENRKMETKSKKERQTEGKETELESTEGLVFDIRKKLKKKKYFLLPKN